MARPLTAEVRTVPDTVLRAPRLFATPAAEPRARRVTDALVLAGSALALLVLSVVTAPDPGFSTAVGVFLTSLPTFLNGVWQIALDLLVVLAIALVLGAAFRRRGSLVRDLLLACALAFVTWLVLGRMVAGSWPAVGDSLTAAGPPPWFPSPRIAIPAAAVLTASPHLARPIRRLGHWVIAFATFAACALGAASPTGALAGVFVALAASSVVHLVFGSCGGRPGLGDVERALGQLGVRTLTLGAADRQEAGLFLVEGQDEKGQPITVKVFGRDAHDAALLSTVWRTLWLRDSGSPIRFGRRQQVEHEAFMTLLAHQAGVPTDVVITAGSTAQDDALLVLRREGVPLTSLHHDELPAPEQFWGLLADLHRSGISHGKLDHHHFLMHGTRLGVIDFRGAQVAASESRRRSDEAQVFVTTVLLHGEERALAGASAALGRDGVAQILPFLQPAAITPTQRDQVDEADLDLDDLRNRAAAHAGEEPPELQRLRRITAGSVIRVVLPAIAVIALISGIAGLDIEEVADALRDASWWIVLFGFVFTQLPRLTQSLSTLGASPIPLPLGPVYALQLAVSYINLAIPSSAARIAVNIRFFQRHGVPAGTAMAAGALDGVTGFVVQAGLLLSILLLTPATLGIDLDSAAPSGITRLLLFVVVLAIVAIVVVLAVRPWRQFVFRWARRLAAEAMIALRGLKSPRRLGLLIGGNLATEVLFALSLGIFVQAFGFSLSITDLLLINISVALLSGLLPIPGGIGVAEGGLTYGLVRAGIPEETAFAAVICYRMASFYLPPIWGFFAMRWLERNRHL